MMRDASPSASMAPLTRRIGRWKPLLAAAAIVRGGGVCGAAVATYLILHVIHHTFDHPDMVSEHITARLTSFLKLDESQSRQVRRIIAGKQGALAEIRRDIQPRVEVELSDLESEIDAVLTEEQRVKWREHVRQFREHWLPPSPAMTSPEH